MDGVYAYDEFATPLEQYKWIQKAVQTIHNSYLRLYDVVLLIENAGNARVKVLAPNVGICYVAKHYLEELK